MKKKKPSYEPQITVAKRDRPPASSAPTGAVMPEAVPLESVASLLEKILAAIETQTLVLQQSLDTQQQSLTMEQRILASSLRIEELLGGGPGHQQPPDSITVSYRYNLERKSES
jgi:hypothetical protein